MSKNTARYYWWCQIGGWSLLALMTILLNSIYDQKVTVKIIEQLGIMIFSGMLTTHLFREFIRRSNWLMLPVEKAFPKFLLGVFIVCIIAGLIGIGIVNVFDLSSSKK